MCLLYCWYVFFFVNTRSPSSCWLFFTNPMEQKQSRYCTTTLLLHVEMRGFVTMYVEGK